MKLTNLPELEEQIKSELFRQGLALRDDLLFNPSFAMAGENHYVFTLRKYSRLNQRKTQLLFEVRLDNDLGLKSISQAQEISSIKGHQVRDMKLGQFGERIFATWNTGHPRNKKENNELFISPYKSISNASKVVLEGRARVEKNWGFFQQHGSIRSLYRLDQPVILESDSFRPGSELVMRPLDSQFSPSKLRNKRISIGSQPISYNDQLVLTCHWKPGIGKFRAYLPLIVFMQPNEQGFRIKTYFLRIKPFSLKLSRLNPFAFAVNYASGLAKNKDGLLLGLGVADEDFRLFLIQRGFMGNGG